MNAARPIDWTTAQIVAATGGKLLSGRADQRFADVGIDSRRLAAEAFFVAIVGDVHDGHHFCDDVIQQGAKGVLVAQDSVTQLPVDAWREKQITCIAVADTTKALGDMAAFNRQRAGINVVAITGSNGKTTTRKLTAAVVGLKYKTLATRGNLNNAIGLPLTLLRLAPDHQWAILELGTNHPGEIAALAAICTPDIGVITNIAPAHLEGLGSLDGVMRAKGELLQGLKPGGKAVLNADDPRVRRLARECHLPVVLFGTGDEATVRAENIEDLPQGVGFDLVIAGKRIEIVLQIPGRFMVTNALAAAAVGHLLGQSLEAIKQGLERVEAENGRMAIIRTIAGITIIDDAYNANPASMQAAFDSLNALSGGQRCAIVLGDMLELGEEAVRWHRKVGKAAAQSGAAKLYFTGEFARAAAESALESEKAAKDVFIGTQAEIISELKRWLGDGDWVLIKGSRGMQMEKIVKELKEWADGPE